MASEVSEDDFRTTVVRQHFTSPHACFDTLFKLYGAAEDTPEIKPKFLFRGESSYYPTSTPGTYRALTAASGIEIKFARIDATEIFNDDYEDEGGDREDGECLAQHYLSTSDGLDFSASLGVALAFALGEKERSGTAYVGVLDYEKATLSHRFCLRDLRMMRDARRPVRQHGFVAVHHAGHFIDLKEPLSRNELGLDWYSFDLRVDDVISNRHPCAPTLQALYDIRDDVWAKRMIQHLKDLVSEPSPQWGKNGLAHVQETLDKLLSN